MQSDLRREVSKLSMWLRTNRHVDEYHEWWLDQGVVGTVQRFVVASVQLEDWTDENVTDLLYLLEHSSTDYLAELLTQSESMGVAIARHSLSRGGIASDDIAEQLGRCVDLRDEAEFLLLEFAKQEHERTRRMALLSLAKLQSSAVPSLAVLAWETGDEYQRIGALSALETIGSDLLSAYLIKAQQDGREHLVAYARRCAITQAGLDVL